MDFNTVDNYRLVLSEGLAARCERNPRYSQRAFARDLGIPAHRLSQVLRAKQGLSRRAALGIARRLDLTGAEQAVFCDLVDKEHARSAARRDAAAARLAKRRASPVGQELQIEEFHLISDWYHLAIVELAKVRGFRSDPRWIAGCLGISEAETRLALDRLERLGIIARDAGGEIELKRSRNIVAGGVPSEAVRNFHRRLIERGLGALATQPVTERENNTSLLAIPRRRLPEVRARITEFWTALFREFASEDAGEAPDELYCLAIQLFHLTNRAYVGPSAGDQAP